MNLVACPSCNCHFDVGAAACPHCGDVPERAPNGQIARTAAAVAFGLASITLPAMAVMGCGDSSGTGGAGGTGTTSGTTSSTKAATTGATTGATTNTATASSVASAYGVAATSSGSAGTTASTGTGN